jgi:hypothetical protein
MSVPFTLTENVATRVAYVAGTVPNEVTFGEFIDTYGYHHITFKPLVGAISTGSILLEVYENSAANSSGATPIAGAVGRMVDGTADQKTGLLEVNLDNLLTTSRYVGLRITPPAAVSFFAAIADLSIPRGAPVLNGTAQGVSFVTVV